MKHIALSLLPAIFLIASCSKRYYAPALFKSDVSYMPKPASFDSTKNAFYLSGGMGVSNGENLSDDIVFGTLDVSAGHAFKNFNIAYGAFGYAGGISNENNRTDELYPLNTKSFYGAGGRFSANLYKHEDNTDIRYLGVGAVYNSEFGDYAAYRKKVKGLDDYDAVTATQLLTLGLTTEVLWHSRQNEFKHHSLRLFVGRKLRTYKFTDDPANYDTPKLKPIYIDISYFMQIKHYFGMVNLSPFIADISPVASLSFKLGYHF